MDGLAERYTAVLNRIHNAAQRTGRNPDEITLVAVTKTWPVEVNLAAYAVGIRNFGENHPEELARKAEAAIARLGTDSGIIWHQIGVVQSRKTKLVAQYANVLHALDRLKIANRLSRQLADTGKILPVFLEVNLSGEASKSGFQCSRWEEDATQQAEMRKVVEHITNLPGLSLYGLMTMAPWHVEEAIIRTVFRRTRLLAEWMQDTFPSIPAPLRLSMGMTDDFEIAIEEGATHVRVGRAIFGERDYSN